MAEKMELPEGVSKEDAEKFLESQPIVFKTIETGPYSQIRIHKTSYKKRELLSIQKFWREPEPPLDDWQYGKAIAFKYEDIDDLIKGLTKMRKWCEENPKEDTQCPR